MKQSKRLNGDLMIWTNQKKDRDEPEHRHVVRRRPSKTDLKQIETSLIWFDLEPAISAKWRNITWDPQT